MDVFAIGNNGKLYQNSWDIKNGTTWSGVMKNTLLNVVSGSALFATVDPATPGSESLLRVFVVDPTSGNVLQATRTWSRRNILITQTDFLSVPGVTLNGPELCRRPVGYSNSLGTVSLYSIGSDGAMYSTSFSAAV